MNALGTYLLAGKLQAVGIISLLTVLSLLLPPFSYIISGTPFSLVTLRKGPSYAMHVLAVTVLLTTVVGYFTNLGVELGVAYALGVWSPALLCATVLRVTESQGLAVLAATGVGVILVLGIYLFTDDLTVWWQAWIDSFLQQNFAASEAGQMRELFDATLPLINGIIASGVVISLVMTVLAARWWQSRLFNPGGFRQEFHRLLLPKWLTIITFFCLLLSLVNTGVDQWLIRNLLIVLVVIHTFQGIASVHRTVFTRQLSRGWLIGMYSFLVFLPQMALFLACIGMADVWVRNKKSVSGDAE